MHGGVGPSLNPRPHAPPLQLPGRGLVITAIDLPAMKFMAVESLPIPHHQPIALHLGGAVAQAERTAASGLAGATPNTTYGS